MLKSKSLYNKRVYASDTNKSIGKLRAFLFCEKKCIGFLIKRPDLLLMFRRKMVFVPLEKCQINESQIFVDKKSISKNTKPYAKAKNIQQEKIVQWQGAPVKIKNKEIGFVGQIAFDEKLGEVEYIELSKGALAGVILGNSRILIEDIAKYSLSKNALIIKDQAKIYERKEGLADKAGKGASVVVHTVKSKSPKVVDAIQDQSDKIHKMFGDFKDEIKKGMSD